MDKDILEAGQLLEEVLERPIGLINLRPESDLMSLTVAISCSDKRETLV